MRRLVMEGFVPLGTLSFHPTASAAKSCVCVPTRQTVTAMRWCNTLPVHGHIAAMLLSTPAVALNIFGTSGSALPSLVDFGRMLVTHAVRFSHGPPEHLFST